MGKPRSHTSPNLLLRLFVPEADRDGYWYIWRHSRYDWEPNVMRRSRMVTRFATKDAAVRRVAVLNKREGVNNNVT